MINDNDKKLNNDLDNDLAPESDLSGEASAKTEAPSKSDVVSDLDLTPVDQELELEFLKKNQEADELEEEQEEELRLRPGSRRDERQLALYLLYALDRADYSISLYEAARALENGFEIIIPDDSFALELTKGVLDNREELDLQLTPFLKNWRLERLGCCTRLILHLALWELGQPDAVSSIVINEAIELAKMFAEKDAYRFVNGILDEASKQLAAQKAASEEEVGSEQEEKQEEKEEEQK